MEPAITDPARNCSEKPVGISRAAWSQAILVVVGVPVFCQLCKGKPLLWWHF